ncbi:Uncharacterized protein APZ42_031620 [Daphnia magna]|uniref:Uncharacterized protein n=1 Tax=Daphnia magna TaxID=35525 RepID=A0A164MQQ7_9CRUS|nr:Uncharacterized protein APZ42_031620 [Daphnia magna]
MGDQDDFDVFNLLGLILVSHMVNIAKDLGYNDFRILAQVEGAELLQDAVIESFGVNQEYLDLIYEQKKALLGPKCWKHPSNFTFQAGEKDAISSLNPLCLELLIKMPLVFPIPNTKSQQTYLKISMRTAGPIPLHTASLITAKNETVDVMKKEIEAHVNDWCSKRGNHMYSPEDFLVNNSNVLYCKLCHHGYKFTLGVNGFWKATTLLQHIFSKHSPSNLDEHSMQIGQILDLTIEKTTKGKRPSVAGNSDQVCLPKKRSVTADGTGMDAMKNPMVTIHQTLSSHESDQENDPHDSQDESNANDKNKNYVGSSNDESTEESRKINDSGDEELAKEKEASKKKKYDKNKKITNSRPLKSKQNMAKANKNSKKCSSSTTAHLKVTLKPRKTRSDLRRSTMLRVGAYDLYQSLISNHFKVAEEIECLSKRNKELSLRLKEMVLAFKQLELKNPFSVHQESEVDTPYLLKWTMNEAISETSKEKKGRRYNDSVLLDFSLSIWNLGGRHTYEILYDNMPGVFPSPTRIQGKLSKYNPSCVPGVIYLETLLDIIKENNYPKKVLVSEDATAIIPKREYHSRYNAILGPLADSAPPVRIGTFASNNKMTSRDVKRRHVFINKRLKEAGLERVRKNSDEYCFFKLYPGLACNILETDFRSKEKTLIRQGDLTLADKMNFDAAERISKPEVRQLLDKSGRLAYNIINIIEYNQSCLCLSLKINAHTLLLVTRKFRVENTPELLLTWLFGSQQCETFFRAMRALCPVGLNKPNVTKGEFLDRARKADVNLLLQHKGAKDQVIYRHVEQKKNRTGCSREALLGTTLPSDEEIANELKKCQQIAKQK